MSEVEISTGAVVATSVPKPPTPTGLDVEEDENGPDWTIIGVEDAHGCAVLVSDQLTKAQLRRRLDGYERGWGGGRYPIINNILVLEFSQFTMIRGDTYAECMKTLAERWKPPEPGGNHDTRPDPDVGGRELPPL